MGSLIGPLPDWVPELVAGSFRFTPAIAGVLHNEWTLQRVTNQEVVVVNTTTSEELAIPRQFLGHVAGGIVTLTKRLECEAGRVRPANRDVITMPAPSREPRVRSEGSADVVPIRETERSPSRSRRMLRTLVALGCLACMAAVYLVAVYVLRDARTSTRFRRSAGRPVLPASHQPVLAPLVQPGKK
jgi:hypothetical protein